MPRIMSAVQAKTASLNNLYSSKIYLETLSAIEKAVKEGKTSVGVDTRNLGSSPTSRDFVQRELKNEGYTILSSTNYGFTVSWDKVKTNVIVLDKGDEDNAESSTSSEKTISRGDVNEASD